MATLTKDLLIPPSGYRSSEAGLFVAQLDDQSARLVADTRGLTPEALAWQPAPGMNTIGMLLAHIAIVEVFWIQVGPLGLTSQETESVLGINIDDDGMPLPEGAPAAATLAGRSLAFYDDLLSRSREYTKRTLAQMADADLDRQVTRTRRDGTNELFNVRWVLYHMVEHLAGHYGQVNLLSHQYRIVRGG
jgi:uncharacterized damage-inducible protein DinB